MPGPLAVAPLVAPALGSAALISKAAGVGTALTKAALTGLTAYEGAKMIPYFTDPNEVKKDLLRKQRDEFTDERDLWWLDRFRANTSGLGNLNEDGKVTNDELNTWLNDETTRIGEKRHNRGLRQAERAGEIKDAQKSPLDLQLHNLQIDEAEAGISASNAQAAAAAASTANDAERIRLDSQYRANELLLGKTKLLGEIQRSLAETALLRQQGLNENEIALARLGLEEQRGLMMQQERAQDKAADRRQAIFMALMSLMG